MRKILLLSTFFFFCISFVKAQNTEWVVSFGGPNSDKGISIGTDSLGFVYVSGYFNSLATFGTIFLTNSPASGTNKEAFLVKMDSLGNVIWGLRGGNGSNSCCDDRALGMHVTPGGFVYLTGTFWSSFSIGACNINWSGANNHDSSLLTKIDPNGNCVWARSFGADVGAGSGPNCPYPIYDADDHSYDVKVDQDGFIYVSGFFSGLSAEFDAISLTNPNWGSTCTPLGYVGKLDDSGNFVWAQKFDGVKDQRGSRDNRLAIDHFSNVYLVGGFENTGTYGPYTLTSNGEWDAFLFKMDKDGNFIWARNVGSNKTDRADGIAIDYCDNVYICGEYRNPMVFPGANASNGTDTLSHSKQRDIFVAKITTNGDWVWAKRARSEGTDKPYQMSVDANMQVFVAGSAGDSIRFNSNLVLSTGDTSINAFVAQLDGSRAGDWVWAKLGGSIKNDRAGDICEDGGSNVYAVGFYELTANLDGNSITSTGKKDIFVWKLKKAVVTPKRSNCIYVDVQPPGSGYINMNGRDITQFPCLQNVKDSTNQFFDALPYAGYNFVNWDWKIHTPVPNTTNPNSVVYTYTNDTLIVNFAIPIIDTVVYIVQPIGAGTITVDGVNVSAFPYTVYPVQGTSSNLSATANAGFTFLDWDFTYNTPLPNTTASAISTTWTSGDTVYVNFLNIPSYNVTYLINPLGAGTLDIDGVNQSIFPYTETYLQGTNVILGANANANFSFIDWSNMGNILNPSNQAVFVDFDVNSNDTIAANYNEVDTLWVITRPAGTAQLAVGGDVITTSPYLGIYTIGSLLNINISPYSANVFDQWDLAPATLPDYSPSTSFIFIAQDTLFASLNNVLAIQDVGEDIGYVQLYPNQVRDYFTIEIEAEESLDIELSLLDISGRYIKELYQGKLAAKQLFKEQFSLNQSAGVYLVQLRTAKTNTSFKIVKL
jgi:hypothetical protein